MTNWKEELKKYLKEQGEPVSIQETFTDDRFTIMIVFKGMVCRQEIKYEADSNKKADDQNDTYARLLMELQKTPEQRKADRAFLDQWLYNIEHGIGDAHGETIPSNKQIAERLKSNV